MIPSLALLFLVGSLMAAIASKCGLPGLVGLLAAGILIGPYGLDLLDQSLLAISADLRQIALIVILLRAGLSLTLSDLKHIGRPGLLMSCLPASFEILGYTLMAPILLGLRPLEGAIMGAVLSAVSPAVVVPRMVHMIEHKIGTDKQIPQMIMAGASLDDIFVIVLFTTFVHMEQGSKVQWTDFLSVPVSILSGIVIGSLIGLLVSRLIKTCRWDDSKILIITTGTAFMMMGIEEILEPWISVSGLLGVIAMAFMIKGQCAPEVSVRLHAQYGKIWNGAQILLFTLVGAALQVQTVIDTGLSALVLIAAALCFRSFGVFLCLLKTRLNFKERLFCILAYLPKATVQAAIGSIPLALGLDCGALVLSVAVLGILITAPLGAFAIDRTQKRFLDHGI